MTAHYILPPPIPAAPGCSAPGAAFDAMDAVIAHSEHGARRLRDQVGLDPAEGPGDPSRRLRLPDPASGPAPLPAELPGAEDPVILFFGLLRPYKGIDTLLEAFASSRGGALDRRHAPDAARAAAGAGRGAPGTVRFVPRFIDDAEIPALMRARRPPRPSLPRQRAVRRRSTRRSRSASRWCSATSAGSPSSREHGAARLVPPGDAGARRGAERPDSRPGGRGGAGSAAAPAAEGPFSWDAIAARTLELYRELAPEPR